ncbi:MAG: hypothetical protein AVDCRST_MAG64-1878, partial [uncultured Phycisphaerae bacterium]
AGRHGRRPDRRRGRGGAGEPQPPGGRRAAAGDR